MPRSTTLLSTRPSGNLQGQVTGAQWAVKPGFMSDWCRIMCRIMRRMAAGGDHQLGHAPQRQLLLRALNAVAAVHNVAAWDRQGVGGEQVSYWRCSLTRGLVASAP